MAREFDLERMQVIPVPIDEAFAFFAEPRSLKRITPPWLRFRILAAPPQLGAGAQLRYRLRLFGVPIAWRTEITEWSPPRGFVDVQRRGPFRLWVHTHRLVPVGAGTEIHDHVRYRLFLGRAGELIHLLLVRGWVASIFDHRAEVITDELQRARAEQPRRTSSAPTEPAT